MKEFEKIKDIIEIKIENPNNQKKNINFGNKFKTNIIEKYQVEIKLPQNIKDCRYMFYDCKNIIDIDLSNLDNSEITNMSDMFNNCINLKNTKFSKSEINNVNNQSYIFCYF